jgi:hypothetical protein
MEPVELQMGTTTGPQAETHAWGSGCPRLSSALGNRRQTARSNAVRWLETGYDEDIWCPVRRVLRGYQEDGDLACTASWNR